MKINWKVRFKNKLWLGSFLGLIGVLADPTTAGLGDSERAMKYEEPWDDHGMN